MLKIDWFILFCAASVLLIPVSLLFPAVAKEKLVYAQQARFPLGKMLTTWQHWFDALRAFLATYFLVNQAVVYDSIGENGAGGYSDLAVVGGILAVAIILQTVQYKKFFYFTAPVFFLWGMLLAFYGWIPVTFAIVFSTIIGCMVDQVEFKLFAMAALLGMSGYLVSGFSLTLVVATGLVVLPILIAWGAMHHLVCYSRDTQRA